MLADVRSPEQRATWSDLRSTRFAPPGAASGDSARRATYVAALQQAEELFDAASSVGVASAPLPLFYGLSQVGRAIAAAASALSGEDWQLSGHGIKAQQLDGRLIEIRLLPSRMTAGRHSCVCPAC
ncbi:YaaC family protein [Dactylosporangium cerinum]|uniref:YaaC family protein n=1 Tax=Dactylosporangium cerinum TaxID=1434730 RepID=A0ABV9W4I3_9ACTN